MPTKPLMVQKGLYNINKSYLPFYLFLNGISSTFKYTFGNTADIFCKRNTSPKYSNPSGHPANSTGDLQWQSAATPHGKKTGCQTHFTERGVDPEEARWGKRPSHPSSVFTCFKVHTQVVNLERSLNLSVFRHWAEANHNIFRIYPQPAMMRLKERSSPTLLEWNCFLVFVF